MVINYLRNSMLSFPQFIHRRERDLFKQELEFWAIDFNKVAWQHDEKNYKVEMAPESAEIIL